jgi:hypothetical protein
MCAVNVNVRSRFVDQVFDLLDRADCRTIKTPGEFEAAYKLRYDAYRRENWIDPSESEKIHDADYDQAPNGRVFGVFIDGDMASTIRIHVARSQCDVLPSAGVFADVISPRLSEGVVDPTRFAAKFEFSRNYPGLAYVTTRLTWLATEYFGAAYLLATIRSEHQAFYKRVFGHSPWSGERDYPIVNRKIVCMGVDFALHKQRVESRYPFFRSTLSERERLFGGWAMPGAGLSHNVARLSGQVRAHG